ncbi:hypothetical protein BDZ91DRAFT_712725 [Kalaharituber pfeilii]|nr:hypothetical protein BDZ91DRAFT_712725 [Kalaharituber pfeilii]
MVKCRYRRSSSTRNTSAIVYLYAGPSKFTEAIDVLFSFETCMAQILGANYRNWPIALHRVPKWIVVCKFVPIHSFFLSSFLYFFFPLFSLLF